MQNPKKDMPLKVDKGGGKVRDGRRVNPVKYFIIITVF